MPKQPILRLALPTPLRKTFDYLPPVSANLRLLKPGIRVCVPFGRQRLIGVLLTTSQESEIPAEKLKCAYEILDEQAILPDSILAWLSWMADYYHHPVGEVILSAIPGLLRQGKSSETTHQTVWRALTSDEKTISSLARARKQKAIYEYICSHDDGISNEQLKQAFENPASAIAALQEKGLLEKQKRLYFSEPRAESLKGPSLNDEQQLAVDRVNACLGRFECFVLEGVTGSGKTEVYLNIILQALEQGQQALVLVPEIGLTPQFVARFEQRLSCPVALLHSAMNDSERLHHWLGATSGKAGVLIGTRSALFTPLPRLGVVIVDEEHDNSYKQQDSFRYSARDMAVVRAKRAGIPIVLGSATPSLESMHNVMEKRYQHLILRQRAGEARPPSFHLVDLKGQQMQENFSPVLLNTMGEHLARDNQVLLFLNRRGFSPSLLCHDCGWVAMCHRCELPLTYHQGSRRLRCHHCGADKKIPAQCPDCSTLDLTPRGYGTERVEQFLGQRFKDVEIIRIDRDSTRGKNRLHELLDKVRNGRRQILLGTQMLAKGHDFPNVTLAGILDADQGLYGTDFRSLEKLAQLIIQVAGRAGRAAKRGQVVIQTHYPEHPLLQTLVNQGYDAFAVAALAERSEAMLPPYSHAVLLRAENNQQGRELDFLRRAAQELFKLQNRELIVLGPSPSPIEKRAGRFRAQLLLLSQNRKILHQALYQLIPYLEKERRVRWSVDVDPLDMS